MPTLNLTALPSILAAFLMRCAAPVMLTAAAAALSVPRAGAGESLPSVASINVCTDQLVLSLAEPHQILTVSWLSADREESTLAEQAARFPLNYGTAEELLRYEPDVIVAGSLTSSFTRSLLASLGHEVVEIPPAETFAQMEANIERVAAAVGQPKRGAALIADMRDRRERFRASRVTPPVRAIVVRPGGYTAGAGYLSHEMMMLAGLANIAAEQNLDRWGSLAIETLLRSTPELLIVTGYRNDQASLANTIFAHPALAQLMERTAVAVVPTGQWGCGVPASLDSIETMQRAAVRVRGTVVADGAQR